LADKRQAVVFFLTSLMTLHASISIAESGVTSDQVTIGMSTALSGPAQTLGQQIKLGVEACFSATNAAGGIAGRKLKLAALDDGYEPNRTGPNMHQLLRDPGVFAILGNVGTPTAVVAVPIANDAKVPFFGAFTGAGILRKTPPDRYVINFRASYEEEMASIIQGLVNNLKIPATSIAFFTQNDAYGDAVFKAGIKALQTTGFGEPAKLIHGRYQRNTVNVEDGLSKILEARHQPTVVVIVGTYKAAAKFIRLAKQERLSALFVNVSFVGSESLMAELGPLAEGVIVTQVVPPLDTNMPLHKAYLRALGSERPTFASLEGYLAAAAFTEGLRRAGQNPTREGFIDGLETGQAIDFGMGRVTALSKAEHQISHQVWPTIIQGGGFHSLEWRSLKSTPSLLQAH